MTIYQNQQQFASQIIPLLIKKPSVTFDRGQDELPSDSNISNPSLKQSDFKRRRFCEI